MMYFVISGSLEVRMDHNYLHIVLLIYSRRFIGLLFLYMYMRWSNLLVCVRACVRACVCVSTNALL